MQSQRGDAGVAAIDSPIDRDRHSNTAARLRAVAGFHHPRF
jgi:hypothetical protein